VVRFGMESRLFNLLASSPDHASRSCLGVHAARIAGAEYPRVMMPYRWGTSWYRVQLQETLNGMSHVHPRALRYGRSQHTDYTTPS
jgi:hypothetical protein